MLALLSQWERMYVLLVKLYGRNADAGCCNFFGQDCVISFEIPK